MRCRFQPHKQEWCNIFNPSVTLWHLPYMANATQRRRVNTNPSYSLTVKFIPMNFLLNRERGSTQFCYCCWCCSFTLAVLRNATGHGRERLRCIPLSPLLRFYVRFLRNITGHYGRRRGLRCCFEYSFISTREHKREFERRFPLISIESISSLIIGWTELWGNVVVGADKGQMHFKFLHWGWRDCSR